MRVGLPSAWCFFAFQHLGGGDARPAFDDFGDLFGAHGFGDEGIAFAGFGLGQ